MRYGGESAATPLQAEALFVAPNELDDAVVLGPRLRQAVVAGITGLEPLMDYLCAAHDLEF